MYFLISCGFAINLNMNIILKADFCSYCKDTGLKRLIKGLMFPGFRYVYLMRKTAKKLRFSIIRFFTGFFIVGIFSNMDSRYLHQHRSGKDYLLATLVQLQLMK